MPDTMRAIRLTGLVDIDGLAVRAHFSAAIAA